MRRNRLSSSPELIVPCAVAHRPVAHWRRFGKATVRCVTEQTVGLDSCSFYTPTAVIRRVSWKKPLKPSNQTMRHFAGLVLKRPYSATFHFVRLTRRARPRTSRDGTHTCRRHALEPWSEWAGTTPPDLAYNGWLWVPPIDSWRFPTRVGANTGQRYDSSGATIAPEGLPCSPRVGRSPKKP